jgi:hypothetical protein
METVYTRRNQTTAYVNPIILNQGYLTNTPSSTHRPRRALPNHHRLLPRPRTLPPPPIPKRPPTKSRNPLPLSRSRQEVLRNASISSSTTISRLHQCPMVPHRHRHRNPLSTIIPHAALSRMGCRRRPRTRSTRNVPRLSLLPHASPLLDRPNQPEPQESRRPIHLPNGAGEHQADL